jgi:N-acetylglucosaminyl-diphospho-decaprenol L-rhamnosyltransferase
MGAVETEVKTPPLAAATTNPPTRPSVSVVIPSVSGGDRLVRLVHVLLAQSHVEAEIVIADNGLPASTVSGLRATPAKIVQLGTNCGFGAAVNRAVRASEGKFVLLVNDDVVPHYGFVDKILAPVAAGAEMAAGVLIRDERRNLIESAGVEIDAGLGPHDYLHDEPVSRLERPLAPPLGPCGAAAAFLRVAFLDVGGFDEGFFAYGEDLDLALRLRAAGARCGFAPGARVFHTGSATLGYGSLEKAKLVGFSRGYLLRKYGVLRRPQMAVRALPMEMAASFALAYRHRSFEPGLARIRGWRTCHATAPVPADVTMTVGFTEAVRRRYARSNRSTSAERSPPAERRLAA